MHAFPAFFPLAGRLVVVAGQGEGAEAKARLFEGSPARLVRLGVPAAFDPAAYAGAVLAFVAMPDDDEARQAVAAARAASVPVNAVDRPELCDFTTPAIVDRGEVVVAVGTGGASPMLAALMRSDLEARVPEGAGRVAALLRGAQDRVREAYPDMARRRAFLRTVLEGAVAQAAMAGDLEGANRALDAALAAGVQTAGLVLYLNASGPADLLTLRALRALSAADTLAPDPSVDPQILALARRDAERIAPESAQVAARVRRGLTVLRLTGGEPDRGERAAFEAEGVATARLPVPGEP